MDYDDIVHFCEHNTIEVIARQMSKDVQEIENLRVRLEVREDGGPDGIECRDQTIRMQDQEIDRLRSEVEVLKQGMEDCVKQAWKSGYEAGHNHTVEGEWGYAEERAADWFSDSMFSNWTQHLRGEGEK